MGNRVGLLDIDAHGPTIPTMLGPRNARPAVVGETMMPVDMGGNLKVMQGVRRHYWKDPRQS
jgi:Mrp family chromosome partitioning ATPase